MDIKPQIEQIKKIREENLFELYKPFYLDELQRQYQLRNQIDRDISM